MTRQCYLVEGGEWTQWFSPHSDDPHNHVVETTPLGFRLRLIRWWAIWVLFVTWGMLWEFVCPLLYYIIKRVWGKHPWYPVFLLKTCKHDNCYQGKLHRFEPYIQPLGTNTWGHCTNVVFLNQETSTTSGLLDVELEWALPWLWAWQMEVKMSED